MDRKAFIKSCRRNGYKFVEIADFLGVTRQRVDQILHPDKQRARAKVQEAGFKNKPCEYSKKEYSIGLTTPVETFTYNIHFPADLGSFRKIIIGGYATEKCKLPDKKPAFIKVYIGKKLLTTVHMTSSNVSILHKIKVSHENGKYVLKH